MLIQTNIVTQDSTKPAEDTGPLACIVFDKGGEGSVHTYDHPQTLGCPVLQLDKVHGIVGLELAQDVPFAVLDEEATRVFLILLVLGGIELDSLIGALTPPQLAGLGQHG